MEQVVSFGGYPRKDLPNNFIQNCIGNNKGLNTSLKKGSFDTILVLSDDYMVVSMLGKKMPGESKQLLDLLKFVKGNFILNQDDLYWFAIKDYTDQDEIVFECSTGAIFSYNIELEKVFINEGGYHFHGSVNELEKRFLAFLGWVFMSRIPLKQITIYPKDNYCFTLGYLNDGNRICYVGFREAVFDNNMPDNESFKMLCGYEEKFDEYVMGILL